MKMFFCCGFLLLSFVLHAQDRFAELDKEKYMQGDTLTLTCNLPDYKRDSVHFATVYLFVEEMSTGKKWTYRYPLLDGKLEADLIIGEQVPTGKYVVTFITRKRFFDIRGKVQKQSKEQKLNYSILTKNEEAHSGTLMTDKNGSFTIESMLFQDTSYFVFSTDNRQELKIDMATMLDSSSFTIDRQQTKFITVGNMSPASVNEIAQYKAAVNTFLGKTSLPDVVVQTNKKRKVDLFNEEYSKGLFKGSEKMIFDGIEDHRIGESMNVFEFLKGKVAGLSIINNADGISYSLSWRAVRGVTVDVFLDEFLLTDKAEAMINPKDVAMIKIYQPPSYLRASSSGGAIAIYSKKGGYDTKINTQARFRIFGYTPAEYTWK